MALSVLILGSGAAAPTLNRNHTAQIVQSEKQQFLVDCGEGTQLQLRRYKVRFQQINHIFISHLHGDHFFGLVGLLSTMHLLGRKNPVHIYGPEELKEIVETNFKYSGGKLSFSLIFHAVEGGNGLVYQDEEITVSRIAMTHRVKCFGYKFQENPKPRRINGPKVEEFQVPNHYRPKLKTGKDWLNDKGELIKNSELTFDPQPSHTYAYCSDTAYNEKIIKLIEGVDLLYHEATFLEKEAKRAKQTYHSTAKQAATIAQKAKVKNLLIGHFSNRYLELEPVLKEAKNVFESTQLAIEGRRFSTSDSFK